MMRSDLAVKRAKEIFGDQINEVQARVRSGEVTRRAEPTSRAKARAVIVDATATELPTATATELPAAPPAPARRRVTRAIVPPTPPEPEAARAIDESARVAQNELAEHGARALDKIKAGRDSEVTTTEAVGLEALVLLEGRPALLVQDGHFFPPPDKWKILDQFRTRIESTLARVGRIEVNNHPQFQWVGTGFLVGPTAIMTNRHVAVEFAQQGAGKAWRFITPRQARIDFREEFGGLASDEHEITGVIGVHDKLDLALLKISWASGSHPQPLPVAATQPQNIVGLKVYVVGYPAWDGRRNDPEWIRKIFTNIFDVKRLQPGEIKGVKAYVEDHDCSTLGGNSGSAVFALETQQVVGLHYGGQFQVGNTAVPLWKLAKDPLLTKAKVNFV
jgi:V8-like Glu-specific endopeptidase